MKTIICDRLDLKPGTHFRTAPEGPVWIALRDTTGKPLYVLAEKPSTAWAMTCPQEAIVEVKDDAPVEAEDRRRRVADRRKGGPRGGRSGARLGRRRSPQPTTTLGTRYATGDRRSSLGRRRGARRQSDRE